MAHLPNFQYTPLADKGHVRLIRIQTHHDRTDRGVLECYLIHVDRYNLPADVQYTALSYRWGDERDEVAVRLRYCSLDHDIMSNDVSVSQEGTLLVPRSTAEMLQNLCLHGWACGRWLWLDFICLNQQDTSEKNVQVGLMGDVYKLCAEVMVYAGPETRTTTLAMSFWAKLTAMFEALPVPKAGEARTRITPQEVLDLTQTTRDSPEWTALRDMLTGPWFGRLWVMQEAALAQSLIFIWGSHSLRWEQLSQVVEWDNQSYVGVLMRGPSGDLRGRTALAVLAAIKGLRENREGASRGWRCGLAWALTQCEPARSSDPRDRIYGVLGLLHGEGTDLGIVPDYSPDNTARDVFTHATAKWTLANDSYDLMYFAGIGWPRNITDLPSWVPDFTRTSPQYPGQQHRAGKGRVQAYIKALAILGDKLLIQMYIVDTVASKQDWSSSRTTAGYAADIEKDAYIAKYISSAVEFVKKSHTAPWSSDFFEIFWRTLTCNSNVGEGMTGGDENGSPAAYGDACANLDVIRNSGVRSHVVSESTPLQKQRFLATVAAHQGNAAICVTAKCRPALVPRFIEIGDVFAVALGARVPFVLRPTGAVQEGKSVFRLVGIGYVHELREGVRVAASQGKLEEVLLS